MNQIAFQIEERYEWEKRFSFLQDELTENQELIQTYRLHIAQDINQDNLALFCGSYQ